MLLGAHLCLRIRDAQVFLLSPPPIRELGTNSGNLRLQGPHCVGQFTGSAQPVWGWRQKPELAQVRPDDLKMPRSSIGH
jgi:hypothetical protein